MAKYGAKSKEKVKSAMHKMKHGELESGRSGKKVRNPKQAIAIGLSEARKEGAKVPGGSSRSSSRSRSKGKTGSKSKKSSSASRAKAKRGSSGSKKSASRSRKRKDSSKKS
jgi:hypothetical protein